LCVVRTREYKARASLVLCGNFLLVVVVVVIEEKIKEKDD
jgi:hypothetical protein